MPYGHPAGSARGSTDRGPSMPRRQSRRTLVFVLASCFGLLLFGLDVTRISSLQIAAAVGAGLSVLWAGALVRRGTERARVRVPRPAQTREQTCVVVRRFGEPGDRAWSRWN